MAIEVLGSFSLGETNPGLNTAVALSTPLTAQVDALLTGPFGLSTTLTSLNSQLSTAIGVQAELTVNLSNPVKALEDQLASIAQVLAGITATLGFGLPSASASISGSIAASAALAAQLTAQVAGITAAIAAAKAIKLPMASFLGGLNLGVGPVAILAIGYSGTDTLAEVAAGLPGILLQLPGITPTENVYGVLLLTADPSVGTALSTILKTT